MLSPAGFLAIAAEGLGRKKFCISLFGVFGVERAKAQGKVPGLKDPGIASLRFEEEPENPAHTKKIGSKQQTYLLGKSSKSFHKR